MAAIITSKIRIYSAEKFIQGLSDSRTTNNVYLFVARTKPWSTSDGESVTENSPPFPQDTVKSHINSWANMIHLKKLNPSNCSLAICRYDWVKNMVYQEYTHDIDLFDPTLGLAPFYVITDEMNVYKCLYNNNGSPSFIKPTGTSTNVITTADKYQWKFMFNISSAEAQKFLTDHFIPVKRLTTSDNSKQWEVQEAAQDGAINVIKVINGGAGYVSAPDITITGDGTGALANAEIRNGKIIKVNVTNKGSGYTWANAVPVTGQVTVINVIDGGSGYVSTPSVIFSGGGGSGAAATAIVQNGRVVSVTVTNSGIGYTSAPTVSFSSGNATAAAIISGGATLKPIISPPKGHGYDPVFELGGFYAIMSVSLNYDENQFTVVNDFRQLGLILNPLKWNTNEIGIANGYSQVYRFYFTTVTGSSFSPDEEVTGLTSGATGTVLDYDNTLKILRLVNVEGKFLAGETVANGDSSKTGLLEVVTGTATGSGVLEISLAATDNAPVDAYRGYTLRIVSGKGAGQQKIITGNARELTGIGMVQKVHIDTDWTTYPDATSVYSIAHIGYPDLEPNSGYILYVNNARPVTRSSDQLEDFKLILEF